MSKEIDKLNSEIHEYDDQSKDLIKALTFTEKQIGDLSAMKTSSGWKVLEKKIRQELADRIFKLTNDDPEVKILLSLLIVADTKSQTDALKQEIAGLLPP